MVFLPVLPIPAQVRPEDGTGLSLRSGSMVACSHDCLTGVVRGFCQEIARRTGVVLETRAGRPGAPPDGVPSILAALGTDADLGSLPDAAGICPAGDAVDERYSLTITGEGIVVRAPAPVGVFRGLTSLVQLIATSPSRGDAAVALPGVRVIDAPRFAWRGCTLDVARTFFSVAEVGRVIDLLALYKFNALHLQLTADESWRLFAGRRAGRDLASGDPFYTRDDLMEIAGYAAARFITLIPGVNMPGHVTAMLRMYPELKTGRNTVGADLPPGMAHPFSWLDPEIPATFELVETIVAEVAAATPGPYLHIGGDEAFGMPDDLYGRFVRHLRRVVRSLGKKTVGWQETVRPGAGPGDVLQYWIDAPQKAGELMGAPGELPPEIQAAINQANAKAAGDLVKAMAASARILVSPAGYAYLDVPYAESSVDRNQEELRLRVGMPSYPRKTIEESFDWDPAAALGPDARPEHLAGVSGAAWTETITDFDELAFMVLPRLPGIAQKAWSQHAGTTWADYRKLLAEHPRLWAQDALTYFRSATVDWVRDPGGTTADDPRDTAAG